jgi:hypothetical protein
MAIADEAQAQWLAVIGRCLAYLCLKNSNFANSGVGEQAQFLEKLGLQVDDQAGVIGSTPASLRELARQAKNKKKGAKGGKGKAKR